ncbi:MAG: aldo/keto reductase [Bacteroidales bacterium]|nr:aldo/keto reductase [Bacteroidales bacterium]
MDRRHFIKSTAATSMLALSPLALQNFTISKKKYISDRVMLGNTGIEVSRLAMGTGTHGVARQSNQTRQLGIKGVADLLQAAFDRGVFFWDSADQYGTHPHLKEALKRIPREKVVILSKTHATTEKEMLEDLDRFRSELGTDYIDVMLLHMMMDENWPEKKAGAMNVLSKAREEGTIRSHGVSCHSLKALKTAAQSDWVQVDLARINPAGAAMDASVPVVVEVLKQMKASGKAVMGMKIFGAGRLQDRIDECLQYVLAQEYVDCFTIGIETQTQLKDLEKRLPEASIAI